MMCRLVLWLSGQWCHPERWHGDSSALALASVRSAVASNVGEPAGAIEGRILGRTKVGEELDRGIGESALSGAVRRAGGNDRISEGNEVLFGHDVGVEVSGRSGAECNLPPRELADDAILGDVEIIRTMHRAPDPDLRDLFGRLWVADDRQPAAADKAVAVDYGRVSGEDFSGAHCHCRFGLG